MSMYECASCGEDHSTFPQVFMAVNTTDNIFPYHNTEFEQKFNELYRDLTGKDPEHYISESWKNFWSWLGDNKMLWFCSKECAFKYLFDKMEKENESG